MLTIHFITCAPPVQWYLYLSTMGITCPNDGWTGICTNLWPAVSRAMCQSAGAWCSYSRTSCIWL